jgi:hypothetical protein
MAVAYPRKWFVNLYFGRIKLGRVTRMAESMRNITPYFDTWEEAHAHLVEMAVVRLKKAKAELPAAERNLARVKALIAPTGEPS